MKTIYEINTVKGKYFVFQFVEEDYNVLRKEGQRESTWDTGEKRFNTPEHAIYALKRKLRRSFPKDIKWTGIAKKGKEDALKEILNNSAARIKQIWNGIGIFILMLIAIWIPNRLLSPLGFESVGLLISAVLILGGLNIYSSFMKKK